MKIPAHINPGAKTWSGVALLCVVFGVTALMNPFGRDQGIHAMTAANALDGLLVYRDTFNVKPPMTTPTHALALFLFGHNMTAIRWLDLIINTGAGFSLAALCWLYFRSRVAVVSAVFLFVLSYYGMSYWDTAQTDGWTLLPSVLAILCSSLVVKGPQERLFRDLWLLVVAGALVGIAVFYKYTVGLLLPVLMVQTFLCADSRRRFLYPMVLAGGFGLVCVLMLAWLILSGAWDGFIDSQVHLNTVYAGVRVGGVRESVYKLVKVPYSVWTPLSSLIVAAALFSTGWITKLDRKERQNICVCWWWLLAAAASPVVQGKYFAYHFLPMLAPMAVLGGWAVMRGWQVVSSRLSSAAGRLLCVVAVLALSFSSRNFQKWETGISLLSSQTSLMSHWEASNEFGSPDFALKDDLSLVAFLEERVQPADRVNIWGFEPLVNFLLQAPHVSRFIYNYPCVTGSGLPEFREEYLGAIVNDPPEYFIVQRGDRLQRSTGHKQDSLESFQAFPELSAFVGKRYEKIGEVGDLAPEVEDLEIPRFIVYRLVPRS